MKTPAPAPDPATDGPVMVSLYAAQKKVYPRSIKGLFASWRWFFVFATQIFYYGMPWVQWGGRQAMLFDLDARRFYIFGLVLYPQDVIYLTAILIISAMLLFLFTAVAGRQWCGYACPQTVYTEIYLWVEKRFEGDRQARMRLDAAPMSLGKLWRKGGKHLVWIAIGLWTGFTFVGYFTPIRELAAHVLAWRLGPWETFWVFFYGFATWGNAGFMREQVCKYMCPYARFQSAMFDKDTLIVTYDAARGEPRGGRSKKADPKALGLGDCIDCTMCVQVCPTGIDIRKGLQAACISCGVCIDACNSIMDKIKAPRGLIRFSPLNPDSPTRGAPWRKPRLWVYGGVITAVVTLMIAGLMTRPELRLDVQRDRGVLARMAPNGDVENLYRLQIRSATLHPQHLDIQVKVDGTPVPARLITAHNDAPPELDAAGSLSLPVTVSLPYEGAQALRGQTVPLRFEVRGTDKGTSEVLASSTFRVPH